LFTHKIKERFAPAGKPKDEDLCPGIGVAETDRTHKGVVLSFFVCVFYHIAPKKKKKKPKTQNSKLLLCVGESNPRFRTSVPVWA
jgi:hypothetical protein